MYDFLHTITLIHSGIESTIQFMMHYAMSFDEVKQALQDKNIHSAHLDSVSIVDVTAIQSFDDWMKSKN